MAASGCGMKLPGSWELCFCPQRLLRASTSYRFVPVQLCGWQTESPVFLVLFYQVISMYCGHTRCITHCGVYTVRTLHILLCVVNRML